MRYPKEKKERSLGERLQLKGERCRSPKCAMVRKPYRPGMHGHKRQRKMLSDFGRQIKEKQKFKWSYGIDERNLRHIFERAERKSGSVASQFLKLLELRLDNVIFRLGFAASRSMARQLVNHGHVMVNGRRVKSPGFELKLGDIISVRPSSVTKSVFKNLKEELSKYTPPAWLSIDADKFEGKIVSAPDENMPFEVNLLVESFSK
mgnify:FL=1